MSVRAGAFCVINGVSTGRSWSIAETSDARSFVASNTSQGTGRRPGNKDWSGSYEAYGSPTVKPGDIFTFEGYIGSDGVAESSYSGSAIIDSIAITWNWAAGDIISHVVNFSGNGEPTGWGTTVYTDTTDVNAPGICGAKIQYGDINLSTETDWENVTQAVLTLTRENQAYVNSSTNCWNARVAGPALDFTLAVTEQNSEGLPASLEIGSDEIVNLFINSTEYWELRKCHVDGASGLSVNRETGAIVQRTVNLSMSGLYLDGSTPTVGSIKSPGGATYWP